MGLIDPTKFQFHVFSDQDGVLADFNGGFLAKFGKPFESFHTDYAWELINGDPSFFRELELLDGRPPPPRIVATRAAADPGEGASTA